MVNTSPSGHSDQNRTERERPLGLLLSLPIIRSILQDWVNRLSSSFDLWLLEAQLKFVWKPNKYWSRWLESPFPLSAQARVTPSKHLSAAMQQIAQQFSFLLCILFFNRVLYNFSSPFFCASSWYSGLQSTRLQQWLFNWVALYPVFLKFFCIKLLLFVVCGLNKHLRSCFVESVDCVTSGWLKWWQVWRKGLLG